MTATAAERAAWLQGWEAARRAAEIEEVARWASAWASSDCWSAWEYQGLIQDDVLPSDLAEKWLGRKLLGESWERPLLDVANRVLDCIDRARCPATTRRGTRCRNTLACPAHRELGP